jgi:hypothetical protein
VGARAADAGAADAHFGTFAYTFVSAPPSTLPRRPALQCHATEEKDMLRNVFTQPLLRRARTLLLAGTMLALPLAGSAATYVSVAIAPPALPVYLQPAIPGPGYLWTPGYWAWGADGYYWVPGTWVLPPTVGLLWTPGWWGWRDNFYVWNPGYWGPRVGFYGGINYGYGYFGSGYAGGYWRNNAFYYNRAVNHVDVNIVHNTYNTVVNTAPATRISYNGGARGVRMEPNGEEREFMHEHHYEPTQLQLQHEHGAASQREFLASQNHGRPTIAATPQPGVFDHQGAVAARGTPQFRDQRIQNNERIHEHAGAPVMHDRAPTSGGPQKMAVQGGPQHQAAVVQGAPQHQATVVQGGPQPRMHAEGGGGHTNNAAHKEAENKGEHR